MALHERIIHLEELNHVELVGRPSPRPDGEAIDRRVVPSGRARGETVCVGYDLLPVVCIVDVEVDRFPGICLSGS